jgi:hypothetical protein
MNKPKVYVNVSRIQGKGLFIGEDIPANTRIILVADMERYYDGLRWISRYGALLNHQKKANCILKASGSYYFLYSDRYIHSGEELTVDYTILPSQFSRNVKGYFELV